MKAIITCGPAFEPIDSVRRITNHSTGEIGVVLSDVLSDAAWEVICFRGQLATHAAQPKAATVIPFSTNADLSEKLSQQRGVDAVFHAAALCDFGVRSVEAKEGAPAGVGKISSEARELELILHPLPKMIRNLRRWFPEASLIGWKYEVDGSREMVIKKAVNQITLNQTDACIVNGPAFGLDFGFCERDGLKETFPDKISLARSLADWVRPRRR